MALKNPPVMSGSIDGVLYIGVPGPPGKTPVRGVDYWTDEDKKEIVEEVLEQIPEIDAPDSVNGAVLYTEQELTPEQQEQARKNIGALPVDTVISLSTEQVNALDALFRAASYNENVSSAYATFCDAFGLTEPDEPDVPDVVIPSVKQGSVSFDTGKMGLNGTMTNRATLIPIGQYLKNGATYKFSIGDAASSYVYGVQIFVADSPALEFPHAYENIFYDGVSEQLVDSGWIAKDYSYTVDKDNCILAVNFRKKDYTNMSDSDYAVLFEAFTIEEQAQPDVPDVPDVPSDDVIPSIKQGSVSFDNGKMGLNGTRTDRATLIPIGQYLKNGASCKFSLGEAASAYVYGVQIFVADSPSLKFPHANETISYDGVSERIIDSGWITTDFTYTANKDNCIWAVNFKKKDGTSMSDSDYTAIFDNFVYETLDQLKDIHAVILHRYADRNAATGNTLWINSGANTARCVILSASMTDKKFASNDNYYCYYSPIKIPTGAECAHIMRPTGMRYGVFVCEAIPDKKTVSIILDSGWKTDDGIFDVSDYADGNYWLCVNISYINNGTIPEDFDTSQIDFYFTNADGNKVV